MENRTKTPTKKAFMNIVVFLILSFPMGLVSFIVMTVGISLGMGTLVIWLGLPILFATLVMVHALAWVERMMVRNLLQMPHPDQPYGREPVRGFLRKFGNLLRDPYTWTGMVYMLFIKLPLGIFNFTLTLVFLSLSAALTFLPLVYLLHLFIDSILLRSGIPSVQSIIIPYFLEIHGTFDPLMFARSFAGVPLGLVLWFATGQMLKGLACFSGVLANTMLGPGAAVYSPQPHTLTYAHPVCLAEQHVYTS